MAVSISQSQNHLSGQSKGHHGSQRNRKQQQQQQQSLFSSSANSSPSSSSSSANHHHHHHSICDGPHSAALDIAILILVLGTSGYLVFPYVKFLYDGSSLVVTTLVSVLSNEIHRVPIIYFSLAGFFLVISVLLFKFVLTARRKCGKQGCRGFSKSAEFDIKLETEDCVKKGNSEMNGERLFELGSEHKDLEDGLRNLAPPNGRAVLIFRAKCGCPTGRVEVFGNKRPSSRMKK